MKVYLDLVQDIIDHGSWQNNRTGIRTLSLPGAMMRFDLRQGFPAVTSKKLAFRSAIAELVGFLRGYRSAADFRRLGAKVWDQNANENPQWLANPYRLGNDDLGPVYGVQWRHWPAYKLLNSNEPRGAAQLNDALQRGYQPIGTLPHDGVDPDSQTPRILLHKNVDQLRQCLDTIHHDPDNRRILFHGWNWAQLEEMALPPCHLLYQFLVHPAQRELSLCLYIRSNDIGLGAPFNIAEGAALLHLVGRLTGYAPRWFTYFIGDAHIYENHLAMLQEQLRRPPLPPPRLAIAERVPKYAMTGRYQPEWLDLIEPSDFSLEGYQHHPPLSAIMAV